MSSDSTRFRGRETSPAQDDLPPEVATMQVSEAHPDASVAAADAEVRSFSEKEVGQVIALATRLQMQASPRQMRAAPTSTVQLREIARSLGVGEEHLNRALAMLAQGEGSIVVSGQSGAVRQRLAEHFATATWHTGNAQYPVVTPRILFDGQAGLSVEWGGASLRLHLTEQTGGTTGIAWEASYPASKIGGAWTNAVFGTLAVGPALVMAGSGALGAALIWGLSVGGSLLGARVLQERVCETFRRRFTAFCRNHLENLQVLLLPRPGA